MTPAKRAAYDEVGSLVQRFAEHVFDGRELRPDDDSVVPRYLDCGT